MFKTIPDYDDPFAFPETYEKPGSVDSESSRCILEED
jgi:hypothetical protein